jgi:hypothetical protein
MYAEPAARVRPRYYQPVMERSTSALALAALLGCGVAEKPAPTESDKPFACRSDADCGPGSCLSEFGICTRPSGSIETLLFEVTPQASDPVYGGASFLTLQNVADAPPKGARLELNVRPRVPVTGRVLAPPELSAACLRSAQSTLKVALTFTPREQLLGLSLPSYELATSFDDSLREYVFQGALPPGRYDVYMKPDQAALGENCQAVPQIFRDRSVGLIEADDRMELKQPALGSLRLAITWADTLEGWQLDMVHPITGEVLSNRVILRGTDVDPTKNTVIATLNYSRADQDFIAAAEELVRLTPPVDVRAGTVFFTRYGLELYTGEGAIGNVSSFGTPVQYQAWVWKEGAEDQPVPGAVSFSAIDLDEVAVGVLASFEATARVDSTGQVQASLLPGKYRVRVTPPGVGMGNLGLDTGYESTVTVWPNGSPALDSQGGHVIPVPPAVSLSGRVLAESNGMPLEHVEVRATGANPERNLCAAEVAEDASAPGCQRPQAPVLQRALAQDPFIPRTRTGLTQGDGRFTVNGLDCGRCKPEETARFDLTVRPDVSTGLPWLIRSSLDPYADADALAAEPLRVPMPVARPVRVTYGARVTDAGADPGEPADDQPLTQRLSGALVRVFAVLDAHGQLVTHPEGLPPCVAVAKIDEQTCLQSLIQVAEARTDSEGDFLLLLPPDVN